ncbi:hypothetical protein M0802_005699 [Mischocyttarus mexicanus]|nr:hypothetical protein M0802_005699 [Mischocyttarus mexicanus]
MSDDDYLGYRFEVIFALQPTEKPIDRKTYYYTTCSNKFRSELEVILQQTHQKEHNIPNSTRSILPSNVLIVVAYGICGILKL